MMTGMKRIAVVIPKYGLIGGAENFAKHLTKRLTENLHYQMHVFANKWVEDDGNIIFHKVPIFTFPKFLTTISFAYYAGSVISNMSFDIIHTHDRLFKADLFTMHSIPHRLWVREVRKKKRMSLFDLGTQWVEKALVTSGKCRKYLAVSQLAKEKFLQEYGNIRTEQVKVIHPGIDAERFQKRDKRTCRKEIRDRFGIAEKDMVLLFSSMNYDIRGLDNLMSGFARVKAKHPTEGIRLLVVGKGNERKYESIARTIGIREAVIFAGVADRETLEKIYVACDMFSILSQFDTFSMTVLEAMAASLPVMLSSNVGARDLIEEGVNGFVIKDTADAEVVADRIGKMLDESARIRMAEEAYRTASRQSWSETARKVAEIYEEILREKNLQRIAHPSTGSE